jgi:RNA polymerase sigma-70 factor (ECF subfamily)
MIATMVQSEPYQGSDVAAGDATAAELRRRFVRLAEEELDRSYRLAGLILGSAAEAEDAVGDALERAWREAHLLRDAARFQAWFDRILVNGCRDRLRRRRTVTFVPIEAAGTPVTADPFRLVDDEDALVRATATLAPEERIVVMLHFWADLTLESVADRLGWPLGTVKSRLHRALERLRQSSTAAHVRTAAP